MNFIKINEHFEITEGSTYELVNDRWCSITSPGTLRALTRGSIAEAWAENAIAESCAIGSIAESWVPGAIAKASAHGAHVRAFVHGAISIPYYSE